MSQFFESRCNGRQNGAREPRVFKDIPDGEKRSEECAPQMVARRKEDRKRRHRKKKEKKGTSIDVENPAQAQRKVWAEQAS